MTPEELEGARQFVEKWRTAGPMLEQAKTQELRKMTDEEARIIANDLLSAVPSPHDPSEDPNENGLVIQQRWFMKAREAARGA
jgi:hypothetical protein